MLNEIEKKIIRLNSEFPLFKNIPAENQEDSIKRMMVLVCGILGIKNLPDPLTLPFIIRFIRDSFGSLSIEAMVQAFELNALGEFQVEKKTRHEHFQNFSIEFIADVLGDYLLLKRKVLGQVKGLIQEPKDQEQSEKECYDYLVSFVKKNGEVPKVYNWDKAFRYMKEAGLVTESNEWMMEFKQKISDTMIRECKVKKLTAKSSIERASIDNLFNDGSVVLRCRKEYVIYKLHTTPTP